MAKTVSVDVSHSQDRETVKRKIEENAAKYDEMLSQKGVRTDHRWEGDTMHLTASALGQTAHAVTTVLDDKVHVEVSLPFLLSRFAEPLAKRLKKEGQTLLARP